MGGSGVQDGRRVAHRWKAGTTWRRPTPRPRPRRTRLIRSTVPSPKKRPWSRVGLLYAPRCRIQQNSFSRVRNGAHARVNRHALMVQHPLNRVLLAEHEDPRMRLSVQGHVRTNANSAPLWTSLGRVRIRRRFPPPPADVGPRWPAPRHSCLPAPPGQRAAPTWSDTTSRRQGVASPIPPHRETAVSHFIRSSSSTSSSSTGSARGLLGPATAADRLRDRAPATFRRLPWPPTCFCHTPQVLWFSSSASPPARLAGLIAEAVRREVPCSAS